MQNFIRSLVALTVLLSASLLAADLPGKGYKVYPLQSNIAEEKFQTMLVSEGLKRLGYTIEPIKEVTYPVCFETIAQNSDSKDIYFMADDWVPLHNNFYSKVGGEKKLYRKGTYITNSAQGYLIDKKTADKYGIKFYNDLKDPKLAKLFDSDGDSKADLVGCPPGWGCEKVIEHQMDAYGMRDTVTHQQGDYSIMIADVLTKYKKGMPILYYTWTPYWLSGVLIPGRDVVWLQVTHDAHPVTKSTKLSNGMNFGFNINSQHIVANQSVAKNHPAAAKLFELMKLSVNDVSAQNKLMKDGEKTVKDIQRHTNAWIKSNKKTFDGWIKTALEATK